MYIVCSQLISKHGVKGAESVCYTSKINMHVLTIQLNKVNFSVVRTERRSLVTLLLTLALGIAPLYSAYSENVKSYHRFKRVVDDTYFLQGKTYTTTRDRIKGVEFEPHFKRLPIS